MSDKRAFGKRRWRLREVLLFSVPPFLLALYVFCASVWDYQRISQYDDWWSERGQTARFMKFRTGALLVHREERLVIMDIGTTRFGMRRFS